ncbi:conserved hypothetical protein [Formosa agariphila KMM 3901]|uniref:Uncharacterized protein n=1 Tax=Formosa agariphila (strain DSM 15362 / KCTC 12365 / LMG 23005 / KMM 3901 / M-2Alg 35-1) TaxID=1347342 RepID=T2KIC0_FORAG|nr:hypothetical protein [Formosa agariphila]CDF78171.1 conserved hypothetical protein [Formosa agariphila KMM 3901]
MKINNNLGIWMNHSVVNLIDLNLKSKYRSILSQFNTGAMEETLNKLGSFMHIKRQQMQEKIYDKILKYKNVVLFNPTNANAELYNFMNKDLHFKSVKIDMVSSDNIPANKQVAFVKKHFENK